MVEKVDPTLVRIGALELRFLVDETQGRDMVVFEFLVPPHARVPEPHFHREVDEFIYGLEGTLTSTVDGDVCTIHPGESLLIERGRVHHHTNTGTTPAKVLVTLQPASIGKRYFEEVGELVSGPGKPDAEKVKALMERYGLIPA